MAPCHIYVSNAFCFVSQGDLFYVTDSKEQLSKPSLFNSKLTSSSRPSFCPEPHPAHTTQRSPPTGGSAPPGMAPRSCHPQAQHLTCACSWDAQLVSQWLWWAAVIISTQICFLLPSWDLGHAADVKHEETQQAHAQGLRPRDQNPLKLTMWAQAYARAHSIRLTNQAF